ncbi:putative ABC-type ATPase [Mucilaginibacter gracilis]|uniref:Putative ABC-type ATPase n=1 Tax=Mucilaginibacter gracilis TaxID=423350 RepID=A0A495IZL2_9SPHI|nr:zeta toxin family protein [Mucilaginibacter gracilis]RKR82156.1 putative ABC-type ATPase [Mucilaginibacter gracilis]
MDYSKPTLLVISGPNGAGKSTFIQFLLPDDFEGIVSFDRDKTRTRFEQELRDKNIPEQDIPGQALRLMEARLEEAMDEAITLNRHFVLETPLSHPDYWKYIDKFENKGYQIQLNYLGLDKIKDCKSRVQRRVIEGGHDVDANTIKGVFEMNLKYINDFRSTFAEISLFDGMKKPTLLARLDGQAVLVAEKAALKKAWIKTGMPEIGLLIRDHLNKMDKSQRKTLKPKI